MRKKLSRRFRGGDKSVDKRPTSQYVAPHDLAADPANPRAHSREQIRAIARSIEAFGFNAPIMVDRNNRIVAGHGRLEAAKLLGLSEVPVVRLEHLTAAQARAYMLADNKLTDRSSWDDSKLAVALKELSEIAFDFEIGATGFEPPEIDLRIQSLDPPDEIDEADLFDKPTGPAVSRLGDLWRLAGHRLVCGSALDGPAYAALMDGATAAAVFTDPPYNVRMKGHAGGKGRVQHREFAMASGEMSEAAFGRFLQASFGLMTLHAADEATFFACMDWRHMGEATGAIRAAGCEVANLCVWVKPNGGMGSLYRSRHELVFVFARRGARRRNNVELGRHGRNRTNVWNYPGANSFARQGRARGLDYHPTVKPIAMVADAILDVTRRGDVILDPFCGSGTTILAAERTGRRGFGVELDPLYVDLAIKRWRRMTGGVAVHASGKTFEQVCAERLAETALTPADEIDVAQFEHKAKRRSRRRASR